MNRRTDCFRKTASGPAGEYGKIFAGELRPSDTSQNCSRRGPDLPRDVNAAGNILRLGPGSLAQSAWKFHHSGRGAVTDNVVMSEQGWQPHRRDFPGWDEFRKLY